MSVPVLKELFNILHHEPRSTQYLGIGLNDLLKPTLSSTTINSRNILPWRNGVVGDKKIPISNGSQGKFNVELDVQQFRPEELSVRVLDGFVIVEGNHEEKTDGHGLISRQFTRRYQLPHGADQMAIASTLSSDGILSIRAPLKIMPIEKSVPMAECVPEIQEVIAEKEKVIVENEVTDEKEEKVTAEKDQTIDEIMPIEKSVPMAESEPEKEGVIAEKEKVTVEKEEISAEKEQAVKEIIPSERTAESVSVKEGEKEVITKKEEITAEKEKVTAEKEEITAMEEEETVKEIIPSEKKPEIVSVNGVEKEVITKIEGVTAEKEEVTAMEEGETVKEIVPKIASEVSILSAVSVPEKQDIISAKEVTPEMEVTADEVQEVVVDKEEEETVKEVKKHRRSPSFDPIAEQPPAKRASVSLMVENAPTLIPSQ